MTSSLRLTFLCAVVVLARPAAAQELAPPQREIPLYPGTAPGSETWTWDERPARTATGVPMVQNVVRPVLQYYPADKSKAVGTAVIVAPGGGWRTLMMSYEGVDIAMRLNAEGVDAFVLKYRLTYTAANPPSSAAAGPQSGQDIRQLANADGQQAVRVLRQQAAAFGVRPDRIGMIGFSAGGAVVLAAVMGPPESRPDFAAPIYAAVGGSPVPPPDAPPLFIAVAADDSIVGYQGSLDLYSAWRKANVPVELHVFQTGQHGFLKKGGGADHFMDRAIEWMRLNGWLSKVEVKSADRH